MPKEEWGVKRLCPTTGKRFYDLNRDPIISPYTGEAVTLDTGKGSRAIAKQAEKPEPAENEEALLDDDDAAVLEEDDAADVDIDDDVLEEDEDDNVSLDDIADVPADDDDS